MGDDDKPFACPASGCGMRFTNEDHLTVHKKKHEMSLNLTAAIKNNLFVGSFCDSDQTPTPTRFIRNCEEVGLFQDLNPFDQQFHKAVELVKSGNAIATEPLNGSQDVDTLNTPAVMDSDLVVSTTTTTDEVPMANRTSSIRASTSALQPSSTTADSEDDDITIISSADIENESTLHTTSPNTTAPQTTSSEQIIELSGESNVATTGFEPTTVVANSAATVVQLLLKLPDGRSVPVQIPAYPVLQTTPTTQQTTTMAFSNTTSLAKMKLKQTIENNQNTSPTANNLNEVKSESSDMLEQALDESMDSYKSVQMLSKRRRTSEEDPDEKRRRFLERNRAAATRCRLKRKQFIQNLEKRADDLSSTNVQLQSEVNNLRNEVAQLKTMLLAHKDCPVTLQQKRLAESGHSSSTQMTTIQITSAEAIASTALTTMAHSMSESGHILPVDIIIESDPLELISTGQENSNPGVDK